MTETKLAPKMPQWMRDHVDRYLSSGGTDGHMYTVTPPNLPTMTEAGISGFGFNLWLGLLAPAGTPQPIIAMLADAANKAMHAADAMEALHKQGYQPLDVGPDEFAVRIRADVKRWAEVVRAAGLKS